MGSEVELYQGDCVSTMKGMGESSVNLIFTSPPYGDMFFGLDIEACRNLIHEIVRESERILAPDGKLIINVNNYVTSKKNGWDVRQIIPMTMWIQECCNLIYQDEIFWCKGLAQCSRAKPLFGSYPYPTNFLMAQRIEYVLVYRKDGKRKVDKEIKELSRLSVEEWREWTQNVWYIQGVRGKKKKGHPAPFPLELPRRVCRLYSFVGDTVLDPCMGIGTVGIECVKMGRNFIGIEIDDKWFDVARNSILCAVDGQNEMELS